mgnify:FL=1
MMNKLRVVYGKSKDAMYISQEDTIRIFSDAFLKAQIPVVRSKDSNLVEMMFAHPLTDGYESTGEIFEVNLTEEVDTRYLIKELNRSLPAGFIVMSAEYVSSNEDSINLRVYAAEYVINLDYTEKFKDKSLREKDEIRSYYRKKMEMYLAQSQILVVKKSYDRMERLDIKPQIEKYNFNIDDSVDIVVSAGARSNISPAILMDGYIEYINEKVPYDVKRVKILYN